MQVIYASESRDLRRTQKSDEGEAQRLTDGIDGGGDTRVLCSHKFRRFLSYPVCSSDEEYERGEK